MLPSMSISMLCCFVLWLLATWRRVDPLPMLSVCELIPRLCDQLFAEAGVMAIEHADFVGVERLAAVIGGT